MATDGECALAMSGDADAGHVRQSWRQQRLLDGGGEFELAPGQAGTNGLLFVAAAEHLLDEELGEGVDDVHLSGIEGLGRICLPSESTAHPFLLLIERMHEARHDGGIRIGGVDPLVLAGTHRGGFQRHRASIHPA